ncbi:hypothetical protein [Bifidobacterium animalis]|uniref:hypothetical protein n=1 Tax=Bifidobacterium animalis TaxID=28025 RepID=UPI001C3EB85B|nr:hypothetical protein [Bifidobacterium animalis]MCR1995060.1 hypothetical protein [Bifidobacterium animalis subsp. animalis]
MNDYLIGVDTRQLDHLTELFREWEEASPARHVTCLVHGMEDTSNIGQWMCDDGSMTVLLTITVDDGGLPVAIIRSAGSRFTRQTYYGDWPAVLGYDPLPLPDTSTSDWLASLIDDAHSGPAAFSQ